MNKLQYLQQFLLNNLSIKNISLGKVKAKENVLHIKPTGGAGFSRHKMFLKNQYYELKCQFTLYHSDIVEAYNIIEDMEQLFEVINEEIQGEIKISYSEKVSGPHMLGFDSDDRVIISLNYFIIFEVK